MASFQSSELTELPVVKNSQLFAQRAHSARYAPFVNNRFLASDPWPPQGSGSGSGSGGSATLSSRLDGIPGIPGPECEAGIAFSGGSHSVVVRDSTMQQLPWLYSPDCPKGHGQNSSIPGSGHQPSRTKNTLPMLSPTKTSRVPVVGCRPVHPMQHHSFSGSTGHKQQPIIIASMRLPSETAYNLPACVNCPGDSHVLFSAPSKAAKAGPTRPGKTHA